MVGPFTCLLGEGWVTTADPAFHRIEESVHETLQWPGVASFNQVMDRIGQTQDAQECASQDYIRRDDFVPKIENHEPEILV